MQKDKRMSPRHRDPQKVREENARNYARHRQDPVWRLRQRIYRYQKRLTGGAPQMDLPPCACCGEAAISLVWRRAIEGLETRCKNHLLLLEAQADTSQGYYELRYLTDPAMTV
jgi:hypothetical protein